MGRFSGYEQRQNDHPFHKGYGSVYDDRLAVPDGSRRGVDLAGAALPARVRFALTRPSDYCGGWPSG